MRVSAFLAPLAATVALAAPAAEPVDGAVHGIQKRGCFGSGESWGGDKSNALTQAQTFCRSVANVDILPGDQRWACKNLSSSKKVDFTVKNIHTFMNSLNYDDCYYYLIKEINGCGRGGATDQGDVFFRFT